MRRRLSPLTRTRIDVAGFFILSGISFAMAAAEQGILFLAIGALVYVHDTVKQA